MVFEPSQLDIGTVEMGLWSDESHCFRPMDKYRWRLPEERFLPDSLVPTRKFGGIMICVCRRFMFHVVGPMVLVCGSIGAGRVVL